LRRRVVIRGGKPGYAAVRFSTSGRSRADGADIRVVVDDRRVVPFSILDFGREDAALVAFQVADPARSYHLYWGNLEARNAERPLARSSSALRPRGLPPAGLFCEIRELGEGNAGDWDQMRRLILASGKLVGRMRMKRCALGMNPFGRNGDYLAAWYGALRITESGVWRFATNSNGPSFVLVGGRVVASWPGWHGAAGGETGRHAGEIRLGKRIYSFAYYFASRAGKNGHVCGIQGPSDKKLRVLSERDCVPLLGAEAEALEEIYSRDIIDFSWNLVGDMGLSGRDVCLFRFTDRSSLEGRKIESWRWRFGDGQTGSGRVAEHLYLEGGLYEVEVELTAAGGTVLRNVARVAVHPRGKRGIDLKRAVTMSLSCDLERLSDRALENLLFLRWEDGRGELRRFYEAARVFFDRRPDLHGRESERYAGALLRELFVKDPAGTVKLSEYLVEKTRDPDLKARALFAAGVVRWHLSGERGKAERLWRRALEKGGGKPDIPLRARRGLLLLLSDLVRSAGRKEEADRLFERALEISLKGEELRRGESEFRFRHHLQAGEFGRAWEALYSWLIADPEALKRGEIPLARAELLQAMGRRGDSRR